MINTGQDRTGIASDCFKGDNFHDIEFTEVSHTDKMNCKVIQGHLEMTLRGHPELSVRFWNGQLL